MAARPQRLDRFATVEIVADAPVATVLLAEDDDAFRRLIASALRLDGFEVTEARNGNDLRERLANSETPFDLIISDVRMPFASGLEIVGAYRATLCATPLIMMTAFGDQDVHAEAEALGAAIFDKPFDLAALRIMALHLAGK